MDALERINKRAEAVRDKHKADVTYVMEHHPEMAEWLAEFAKEFGKANVEYRVTLKIGELPYDKGRREG